MKKILVLSSGGSEKMVIFKKMMSERLSQKDIELSTSGYLDIWIDLDKERKEIIIKGKNIREYDLIYFRRVGLCYSGLVGAISVLGDNLGVKYIDKTWQQIGPMGDKLTSLTKLFFAGIPIPHTIYFSNPKRINKYELLKEKLRVPFVAKDLQSQRGKGVFLIKNESDLEKLKNLYPEMRTNQYMFQEYVEKDHEYRLLVLGEKVAVWEEKIAQKENEFRNNVALGAKEVFFKKEDLPGNYEEIAVNAVKILKMQIAGVDLMTEKGTNKAYLLEVNRGPGFTYDNKLSPELDELTEYMANNISNKNGE
ncbi:MAG TPA: ATP-grasp domain-containing protein [Patescibacteria group bacterium]|nr:ATP-grasp domain-containing protein [Patescibacteria group bacterium]